MPSQIYERRAKRVLWSSQNLAGTALNSGLLPLVIANTETMQPCLFAMLWVKIVKASATDTVDLAAFPNFNRNDDNTAPVVTDADTTGALTRLANVPSESPWVRSIFIDPKVFGDSFYFTLTRNGSTDTFVVDSEISWYGRLAS